MATLEVQMRRFSVVSEGSFEETLQRLVETIGHPDIRKFQNSLHKARTSIDLEKIVHEAVGPSNLMEFLRFDAGGVLSKERTAQTSKIVRLLVGNPIIMKEMAKAVPDAAAYAPVTILIDQRSDGVHLSYDLMESLIAPYGDANALAVAKDLDTKILSLLEKAAFTGDDAESDKPDDPIALAGSLAAADVLLMGAFLGDW